MRVLGLYSSIGLISVPWLRRSFLVREILFNSRILQNPFLVGLPLIKVNRGAQDISLYSHAWRLSKVMSDSSKVCLFPLASFCQLLIPSTYSSCLVQMFVDLKVQPSALRWNRRLCTHCLFMDAQMRLMSSLRPSALPKMGEFINITKLPLSAEYIYIYIYIFI